jgi:thioredoxin 1
MNEPYNTNEPLRAEIDSSRGSLLLEFGSNSCGICQHTQPLLATALQGAKPIRHIKIEDAAGRPLGRSYKVKLWPTLIFVLNGQEVTRVVRPENIDVIRQAVGLLLKATTDC